MIYPSYPGFATLPEAQHADPMSGYELIFALTEEALNRSLSSTFNFLASKEVRRYHRIQLEEQQLEAAMGAPRISLADAGAQQTVWLLVNLEIVKYQGKTFRDWSFAYKIRLRSAVLSQSEIDQMAGISEEVRQILRLKAQEPTAMVRNVMLDFENSSTEAFDASHSRHAGAERDTLIKIGLHTAFSQYFTALRSWENTYSLSFFVEDLKAQPAGQQPTFVPGKGVFSIPPSTSQEGKGSLDLLLMRQGQRNLPAVKSFSKSWAGTGDADGRLTVSWRLFLVSWLLPQIRNAFLFGTNPFRYLQVDNQAEWIVRTHSRTDSEEWKGLDRFVWTKIEQASCRAQTSTEQGADRTTKAIVHIDGNWLELIDVKREALGGGRWWTKCAQPLSGQIAIVAGSDGRLSFQASLEDRKAVVTGYNSSDVIDIFVRLGGNDVRSRLNDVADGVLAAVRSAFQRAETNLSQQLSQSFLLPGGQQFFFKNARFDDSRNLVFDITVKAQN